MRVSDGVIRWLESLAIVLLCVAVMVVAWVTLGQAADLPAKSRALAPATIPLTGCGPYFGVNTMASASSISNSPVPGASVDQAEIGATIGYTCANADGSFYFFEGKFDFSNLNGNVNGLNLTGPVDLFQRVGYGSPAFMQMLASIPGLNSISTPSLPLLPTGVTAAPGAGYFYAGIHEQDVSAQFTDQNGNVFGANKIWGVSPELGVGMWWRLSNGVVADVFAGWQIRANGVCIGLPGGQCPGLGNGPRAGLGFNF